MIIAIQVVKIAPRLRAFGRSDCLGMIATTIWWAVSDILLARLFSLTDLNIIHRFKGIAQSQGVVSGLICK
jgi:hypothetical protein